MSDDDGWGRPKILNPSTGKVQAYTRISTFASTLDEVVERAADASLLNIKADDDVDSYHRAIQDAGLVVSATKQFVVNHDLGVAGTLDHLYIDGQGRQLVGDKETGFLRPLSTAIRLACYAGAELYNIKTGETTPLGADRSTAILIHIPRGEGSTKVYKVNIAAAGLLCELVREVRDARSCSKFLVKEWGA